MDQKIYSYNLQIDILNDEYNWICLGYFTVQKTENISAFLVKYEYIDMIERDLNSDKEFFNIENIIINRNIVKGISVKVKELENL